MSSREETQTAASPDGSAESATSGSEAASGTEHTAGGMRDGAMARTTSRRDLSARRASAAGTAAGASAGRGPGAARTGASSSPRRTGPRRVRLTVQRVDPWSVMKISFLVSVALGIAGVVAVAVLWTVLSGMNAFSIVNEFIVKVTSGESGASEFDLMDYIGFGRVVALSVVFGVINIILLTALSTLTAFLYNVCTALVGGAQLTLADE